MQIKWNTRFVVGYEGDKLVGTLGPYLNAKDAHDACMTMRAMQPGRKFFSTYWKDMSKQERKAVGV